MKPFFKELFEYTTHFNQALIGVLIAHPEKTSEQCIKLMSHMLNAHQIWNNRIQAELIPSAVWDIHTVQAFEKMDKHNFEHTMRILNQCELNQTIQYNTSNGIIFNNTVRDMLFQVINHSTYHRAQIASLFKQSGLEPLLTDYIHYKRI